MASIVFIQPHLLYGGAERQTVIVANEMAARGHTCHVILHRRRGGLIDELAPEVQVHDLGLQSQAAIPLVALRLRAALESIEPSLVIVKLWSSILACSMVDKKVSKHTYNYCEDLDPRDHSKYIRFGRIKQRLIGRVFRARSIVTANTFTVAESMNDVYGLGYIPEVVPSTVNIRLVKDRADRDPQHFARDGGRTQLLSVGTLIPRKGLTVTLEALRLLDQPIDWHLVGDGPLKEELQAIGEERHLRVFVHEATANPYGYMRAADLLVHSATSEAFGIVLVEALATGTPVVAADSIGPLEIVRALGSRPDLLSLYDRNNPHALASDIKRRIEEGITRVDADDYLNHYSLDRAVDEWIGRAARYGK